jgi:hypothetical protein
MNPGPSRSGRCSRAARMRSQLPGPNCAATSARTRLMMCTGDADRNPHSTASADAITVHSLSRLPALALHDPDRGHALHRVSMVDGRAALARSCSVPVTAGRRSPLSRNKGLEERLQCKHAQLSLPTALRGGQVGHASEAAFCGILRLDEVDAITGKRSRCVTNVPSTRADASPPIVRPNSRYRRGALTPRA